MRSAGGPNVISWPKSSTLGDADERSPDSPPGQAVSARTSSDDDRARRTTGTRSREDGCPETSERAMPALVRHQSSSRGTVNVARTKVVSWLRTAVARLPDRSQWRMSGAYSVRYSGGAAPASHRFPWLPSAVQL